VGFNTSGFEAAQVEPREGAAGRGYGRGITASPVSEESTGVCPANPQNSI